MNYQVAKVYAKRYFLRFTIKIVKKIIFYFINENIDVLYIDINFLFRIEIILVVVGGLLGIFTNLALIYGVVYFRRYCSYLHI